LCRENSPATTPACPLDRGLIKSDEVRLRNHGSFGKKAKYMKKYFRHTLFRITFAEYSFTDNTTDVYFAFSLVHKNILGVLLFMKL
jgi:hypothetical protein